eukprot:6702811-Prorocentrum_lima.AAC.1
MFPSSARRNTPSLGHHTGNHHSPLQATPWPLPAAPRTSPPPAECCPQCPVWTAGDQSGGGFPSGTA